MQINFKRFNEYMQKASLSVAALLLMSGVSEASASQLSSIRTAADQKECFIEHEGRQEPAVALTASAYDLVSIDHREVLELISRFLNHGCSIHEADSHGASPINVAVLTAEPNLLLYLLDLGGEPEMIITGARDWANGKNSIEFAQFLYEVDPNSSRKRIIEILSRR